MPKGLITEEFIEKAKEIHGNKYNYSEVHYINYDTKVCIICPEHGEFWQTPSGHLKGRGCPECGKIKLSRSKSLTNTEFIKKAREVHGDKYDYSKVEYVNNNTKVCIICPEHGEFWQIPHNHLKGVGCSKCSKNYKTSTEEFIEKAKKIYNDKYDYSKVEYVGAHTKVCIVCPEHGEFWQQPTSHLNGCGCKKCANEKLHNIRVYTKSIFIEKAREVHDDKYDYSKVEYVNNYTKVCIICPEHGEFWQIPANHLRGQNCPKCHISKLEEEVMILLKRMNITFEYRKKDFVWLDGLELDYYLPNYKIAIECQGPQHYEEIKYFGGKNKLIQQQNRDRFKQQLCEEHEIKLLYYGNKKFKNKGVISLLEITEILKNK